MPRPSNRTQNGLRLLFLQGHPSFLARDLGQAMAARGHFVRRVNLCVGDWFFWHGSGCRSYRGSLANWAVWLEAAILRDQITHIIYFADRTPYHVIAQQVARRLGVIAVSHEFGYLRPDWICVEEGGQSAFSHFPDRLEVISDLARPLPTPDPQRRFAYPHWQEALHEVGYHLGNFLLAPLYPRYVADRADNPVIEYLSYILRNRRARRNKPLADAFVAQHVTNGTPYFVVALQMQADYQIRANSSYRGLRPFIDDVLTSFAHFAVPETRIVFKLHPMDNGLTNWPRVVRDRAAALGIGGRVDFIDGGDLFALLRQARGCVVVNSTVGLHALQLACPVKCLGIATYDISGLTHQGILDQFWAAPQSPDPGGVDALIRLMAAATHVRGDFFSTPGRAEAVRGMVQLIETGLARPFGAFVAKPPRLARALRLGLSIAPWTSQDLALDAPLAGPHDPEQEKGSPQ